jgi:hypothetical protein
MPLFASHPQDMEWHKEQTKAADEAAEREKNRENKLIKEENEREKLEKEGKEESATKGKAGEPEVKPTSAEEKKVEEAKEAEEKKAEEKKEEKKDAAALMQIRIRGDPTKIESVRGPGSAPIGYGVHKLSIAGGEPYAAK